MQCPHNSAYKAVQKIQKKGTLTRRTVGNKTTNSRIFPLSTPETSERRGELTIGIIIGGI